MNRDIDVLIAAVSKSAPPPGAVYFINGDVINKLLNVTTYKSNAVYEVVNGTIKELVD